MKVFACVVVAFYLGWFGQKASRAFVDWRRTALSLPGLRRFALSTLLQAVGWALVAFGLWTTAIRAGGV